jgi:hypothetical protein
LQVKIVAGQSLFDACGDTGARTRFIVMLWLAGSVNAAKAVPDGEPD